MARVPQEAEFGAINVFSLCQRFYNRDEATIIWCRQNGLLAAEAVCGACGTVCCDAPSNRDLDGRVWHCPELVCRRKVSIRKGSFFEGSHLRLLQVICMTYFWSLDCGRSRGLSQQQIMKGLEIRSGHTVVDWKQLHCGRDVYFM